MNSRCNGLWRTFVVLAALALVSVRTHAEDLSFAGFPVDTALQDQFSQYLTFAPYNEIVTGPVVSSQWGNVASFTNCTGGQACEFFTPGARILFKNTHRRVAARVGALPAQIQFLIMVRLTAYDAGGTVLASDAATIASTGGISTLSVNSTAQNIASVVLESTGVQVQGTFGVIGLSFDPVSSSPPDFTLSGPGYLTTLGGGPASSATLSLHRIGGSKGPVVFSTTGQPAGLTVAASPNPSVGDTSSLSGQASAQAIPGIYPITITATPGSGTTGPAPRSTQTFIKVQPGLSIIAPASVDLASCQSNGAASGTIRVRVTVMRAGPVAPPASVSVTSFPAEVSGG